jgi:DNA-binding protein HU-beta
MTGTDHDNHDSRRANPGDDENTDGFGRQANKGILAERVASELNIPRRTAARVLDAVLDSVRDLLRTRARVAVKGFGTFERKIRKGRAYKHPLSGESIEVADKETILFKPSDQLILDSRANASPPKRRSVGRTEDILFKG